MKGVDFYLLATITLHLVLQGSASRLQATAAAASSRVAVDCSHQGHTSELCPGHLRFWDLLMRNPAGEPETGCIEEGQAKQCAQCCQPDLCKAVTHEVCTRVGGHDICIDVLFAVCFHN